jgi:hypothetical protein
MGPDPCLKPRDAIGCLPHLSTRYGELPCSRLRCYVASRHEGSM